MNLINQVIPIASNVVFVLQETAISPLLVYIVDSDKSGYVNSENQHIWISFLFVSATCASILGYILQGWISFYFGYKTTFTWIYILSIIGNTLQYVKYDNILYVCVGQLLYGLSVTSLAAQTWLNFINDDEHAVQMQIYYNNSYSFGCILGLLLVGVLNELVSFNTWQIINLISIISNTCLLILLQFVYDPFQNHRIYKFHFPFTKKMRTISSKTVKQPSAREMSFRDGTVQFALRNITTCLVGEFLVGVLSSIYQSYLSVTLADDFHYSTLYISIIYICNDIVSLCMSNICLLRLLSRFSEPYLLVVTTAAIAFGYTILGTSLLFTFNPIPIITCLSFVYLLEHIPCLIIGSSTHVRIPENKRSRILIFSAICHEIGYIFGGLIEFNIPSYSLFFMLSTLFIIGAFVFKFGKFIDNI